MTIFEKTFNAILLTVIFRECMFEIDYSCSAWHSDNVMPLAFAKFGSLQYLLKITFHVKTVQPCQQMSFGIMGLLLVPLKCYVN